jgi:hypothetical protein
MGFLDHYPKRDVPHDREMDGEPSRRVYARVDRVDVDADSRGVLLLDSVDADWLDQVGDEIAWLGDSSLSHDAGRRISVVEAPVEPDEDVCRPEGSWWELSFEGSAFEVSHYLNLFAPPLERQIDRPRPLGRAEVELVERVTGLDACPDASAARIQEVLSIGRPVDAVAVYDVGQGACNALLHDGVPLLYFDAGGAALRDTWTFPNALQSFCTSFHPPVVLSHWDWDHWSSARRDRALMHRPWIVPRHDGSLGPVHTRFLGELIEAGEVLVWPSGLSSLGVGGLTVSLCTGSPRDRNNSGLAMALDGPQGEEEKRMLFPGDSAYQFVRGSRGDFTSVVVPHHGGRTRSRWLPGCDGAPCGRLVYSYGLNNSYGHPFADVEEDHAATWKTALHTAHRGAGGLGHVHLYWSTRSPDADPPCGGTECDLTCQQR